MLSAAKHLAAHRDRPFAARRRDNVFPILGVKVHKYMKQFIILQLKLGYSLPKSPLRFGLWDSIDVQLTQYHPPEELGAGLIDHLIQNLISASLISETD